MMPLLQIIIIYMFPIKQRGTAMGLSGLAVGLAPAMGPTFAGWILNKNHVVLGITISDSWRNIFVLPIIYYSDSIYIKLLLHERCYT